MEMAGLEFETRPRGPFGGCDHTYGFWSTRHTYQMINDVNHPHIPYKIMFFSVAGEGNKK